MEETPSRSGGGDIGEKFEASMASRKEVDREKTLDPNDVDLGSALQKLWSVITSSATGD